MNERRIGVLKRVLKVLAHLPETAQGIADREELELIIIDLGGDARTGAHRAIKEAKERS